MPKVESLVLSQENKDKGTLVFSNSLGTHWSMWDKQVEYFKSKYQIILYNTCADSGSTISDLGDDVIALLDKYTVDKAHFCGISLGGLIGQWVALSHPERFHTVTIANTAAKICNDVIWNKRMELVEKEGFSPLKQSSPAIWFSPDFNKKYSHEVENTLSGFDKIGQRDYLNSCVVLRDTDLREKVNGIDLPLNIIAGNLDKVTTVNDAEFINDKVEKSKLTVLNAAHISNIEDVNGFNSSLENFILMSLS